MQVLQRGIFAVALEYNQPALDRCMESVILKEDGLLSAAGPRAFAGAGAGAAKKKQDAADIAERNAKIAVEVKKFQMDEANKIADQFFDVRVLKQARREFVLDRFTSKSASFGQGRHTKELIKSLKCELLDVYCDGLLSELELFSVKGMIARTVEMLCRVTATLPKPKLLFSQNMDPQASAISPARPLEEADDTGRDTSIFMADLSLVNLWRLPHPLEVMEELPKESRTLTQYLDALWAVHNIMQVLTAFANVIPRPLILTKDRLVGKEYVQVEIAKVRAAVENLNDKGVMMDVSSFLCNWQNAVLSKYILSLQSTVYKLLSEGADAQQVLLLRAAVDEATAPLFPPLASFPIAMPHTAQAQATYLKTVRKGPLLHVPVPQPYADMGHKLLTLPEAVRNNFKSEWSKLDVLLNEALQAKNLTPANNAMLAMQTQAQMLLVSRELDKMRARLCFLYSGIQVPRNVDEYKEWIMVYEKEVVARMLKAKEKADRDFSDHQAAALAGGVEHGSAQARVAEKAQADHEALQSEMAQRGYMVRLIHDLCCKLFLQRKTDEALKAHAEAMRLVDVLAIDTPDDSTHKGLHKTALSQAALDARKEDILLDFLRGVRQGARDDKDPQTNVAVLVIPKYLLNEQLDLLAGKLRDWGEVRIEEAIKGLRMQVLNLTHLLYLQERDMQYKDAVREREQQSMARRIDVAVKDQCYALLFRMDDLQRKLQASQTEVAEMERSVRERLKVEFEELVKDLQQQLTLVRAQFTEYREQLQQDMKSNLQEIKKEGARFRPKPEPKPCKPCALI